MAKIVVIDDEPGLLRAVCRSLQTSGHAVVGCRDGRDGIAQLQAEAADLLITDIFMPEMEGVETIRRAHALRAEMPIIVMSGGLLDDRDYLPIAAKFGATATLRKPFRPAELLALVSRLLADSGDRPTDHPP